MLAGIEDSHKILDKFDFGPDRTLHFGSYSSLSNEKVSVNLKCCPEDSNFTFDQIIFKPAGKQDSHKISDEFEFRPDQTFLFEVNLPLSAEKHHI